MATSYPLIILSLTDVANRLSYVIPREIIHHIVNLYRSVPTKPDRILEISFTNVKNIITICDVLTGSSQLEITFDLKNGLSISEKKSNPKLFHIKNINTFYCAKDKITIEVNRTEFNVLLSRMTEIMPLLLYIDLDIKLLYMSYFSNMQISLDAKEIIKPNTPSFKDFRSITVNKTHFDLIIKSIEKQYQYVRPSIKDNNVNFHLRPNDKIKYDIKHFMKLDTKYNNYKTIKVYIDENIVALGCRVDNDILYTVIDPV